MFLDDILLMASSNQELALARDTFFDKCKEISSPAMSDFTIFGHGNQLSRYDLDPSKRKEEDCATVPGSSREVISFHRGTVALHPQQLQLCQHLCNIETCSNNKL